MADESPTPPAAEGVTPAAATTEPTAAAPTEPSSVVPADATNNLAKDVEAAISASADAAETLAKADPADIEAALTPDGAVAGDSPHLVGGKPSPTPAGSAVEFQQPALGATSTAMPFNGIELLDDVEL